MVHKRYRNQRLKARALAWVTCVRGARAEGKEREEQEAAR
ncbi:uncharacterized, partial [Tachysurus ichikawai]